MKNYKSKDFRSAKLKLRRGSASVDMVATLGVTFTLVMAGYFMAYVACRNLHHLISSFVGSPYM